MSTLFSDEMRIGLAVKAALEAAGITAEDPDYATLIEAETPILERLRLILRARRYKQAQSKALGEMQAEMKERRARIDASAERMGDIVFDAMQALGLAKLEAAAFTANIGAGRPRVIVVNPDALPDECCAIVRTPSKTAIAEALKEGPVSGAEWSNATPVLTVRTR